MPGTLLPGDAEVSRLHVSASDVEEIAGAGGAGLLGRGARHHRNDRCERSAAEEAYALLAGSREPLRRPAALVARR